MFEDGFHHVGRASGGVATCGREEGGDACPVEIDRQECDMSHDAFERVDKLSRFHGWFC